MKIVIIGGVAGGATAAARLRRIDENTEITIIERGEHVSFANCGLPYHVGGIIPVREALLLNTPETFKNKMNVNVLVKTEATKINREQKEVTIKDLTNGEEKNIAYDKLLLSPGAMPFKPPIEGINDDGVFTLRNVTDMDKIINWVEQKNCKSATVIGGGFIGLEMVENLRHKGMEVNLVELADQVLLNIDKDMANGVHAELIQNDVRLYLKDAVKGFKSLENGVEVILNSGRKFETGVVIFSAGVKAEVELAIDCGLEMGKRGIKVNEYLQTSDESIYAVGDAVEITHGILKTQVNIPLAGPANRQARIVAGNMLGFETEKYEGAIGTAITKIFSKTVACTGLNSKQLHDAGINFMETFTIGKSNAGYYPGATPLIIKTLFGKNGEIYGVQIVGAKGVDKRIDIFATAIKMGMKVADLEKLELSYAPPFGSAKDPVNIVGYVANNIIKGDVEVVSWKDAYEARNDNSKILLDVRNPDELEMLGTIDADNLMTIPLPAIRKNINAFDKEKEIYIFCAIGARGYFAYRTLKQNGFKVKNISGGFTVYNMATKKFL